MNASDIIRLLNTNHYAPADLEEVSKLCGNFPEFSAVHLLKVRILEALGHEKQQQLKLAAVYSMNRKKLLQLVTEVKQGEKPEPPPGPQNEISEINEFSEESNAHADVIIEQHAPYAGQETGEDLLELDETEELLEILDEDVDEHPVEHPVEETVEEPETVPDEVPAPDKNPLITSFISGEPGPIRADQETGEDLLELDEDVDEHPVEHPVEETKEDIVEDTETSDTMLSSLEKDETEMEEPETVPDEVPVIDKNPLITSFIRGEPGPIRADMETSLKGDVSRASHREHDGFITDTLAQIYVKQGLYAKAIYAYEKLSLKYPEKSAYFAAQIEKIRNINHS